MIRWWICSTTERITRQDVLRVQCGLLGSWWLVREKSDRRRLALI